MNTNHTLAWHDLQWCLRRTPRKLLEILKRTGSSVFVAGGFIRSCIANDPVNDVDVFCGSKLDAERMAALLVDGDVSRLHHTDNAITVRGFSHPIQFIHRWVFSAPEQCVQSFDFTIARAAFWYRHDPVNPLEFTNADIPPGKWESVVDSRFYQDLAAKRLIYCNPIRNEDAGGSMLRVLKFYQRGYRIPLDSLGDVIARLMAGVRLYDVSQKGRAELVDVVQLSTVLTGLLREVDPNVDPSHVAHLPAENAKDNEEGAP